MSVVLKHVEQEKVSYFQPPRFEDSMIKGLGWVEEAIQEGEGYLTGQKSYKNLANNMNLFEGIYTDRSRSTLNTNFLKYNIRKFVEMISDVREIGTLGTDAPQFKAYADIENGVIKAIYQESQFPMQLRKVLQWASVTGVGYMWIKCKAEDYGFGERKIIFDPLGILDVLPVQVPSTNDVQDAYANTIYEYMPIAEAHARFPLFQHVLIPVNSCNYPSRLTAKRLDWAEKFKYGDQTRNWGNMYCEIRYTYIRDMRINTTGYELPMGDLNTSWFYKVPSIGQPIFGGIRNNQPYTRPAGVMDCRLYPNLRLIITSPGVKSPMYDGPAFDWHGKMPAVQYTVDDWPWQALGSSLIENVADIERTKRKHERKMDQVISTRMNPPMGYDRSNVGGPKVENFDLFEENVRMGGDGEPRMTFQSLLPDEVQVTEINYQFLDKLKEMEETQLGINDLGSIMNAKLNLTSDSFDKALETVGPIAKGIAMGMESGNAKVAYIMKWMVPQWYDTKRLIEYLGPDRVSMVVTDFDPASMIPSHNADEYVNGEVPTMETVDNLQVVIASRYSQMERARNFARNLRLISVPSTLLKLTQMQEQLKYLQLYRGGFPISPHTVAQKLGIENFGSIAGDTEIEKWINWMKMKIGLEAAAQQLSATLMGGMETGGGGGDPTAPPVHAGGRPPSGNAPPKIVQKGKSDGNPRTTVVESR